MQGTGGGCGLRGTSEAKSAFVDYRPAREVCKGASIPPRRIPGKSKQDEPAKSLLLGGLLASGEDGVLAVGSREQDRERDGDHHEEHRAPGGELGEQIGRATRAERRLRALPAECAGEVGGLALLQQYDADEEQTDDDVNDDEEDDHRDC